jgi:hypothetical protein
MRCNFRIERRISVTHSVGGGQLCKLPVLVVVVPAGIIELEMSGCESGRGMTINGERLLGFVKQCSFTVGDDVVQI